MWKRLRERNEWKFFAVLPRADRPLAVVWWVVLLLRGVLPAVFAIAMGALVAGVQCGESLVGPLALTGIVFVLLQVLGPIQTAVSHNLGDRTAAWLYDRLTRACVRPPGMGHLEDPTLDGRPHRRARLRPRHDRAAAVLRSRLHRRRDCGDDWGSRCGRSALRLRVVGAGRARRRLARHALVPARERRLARPQHRRSPQRAARRRLRVSAGRGSAGQQRAATVRPGRLDARSLHRAPHEASSAPVPRDPFTRASAALVLAAGHWRQRHRLLVSGHAPRQPAASISAGSSCTRSARSAPR